MYSLTSFSNVTNTIIMFSLIYKIDFSILDTFIFFFNFDYSLKIKLKNIHIIYFIVFSFTYTYLFNKCVYFYEIVSDALLCKKLWNSLYKKSHYKIFGNYYVYNLQLTYIFFYFFITHISYIFTLEHNLQLRNHAIKNYFIITYLYECNQTITFLLLTKDEYFETFFNHCGKFIKMSNFLKIYPLKRHKSQK